MYKVVRFSGMSFEVLSRFTDVEEKVLFHGDSEDHESAIDQTVFDEELWEDMKAGKSFQFAIDAGRYDTRNRSSNFTIQQYIIAQPEGKSLKEIIGEDVAVVTHRAVLRQILMKQMNMIFDSPVEVSCERFDGVTFVNLSKSFQSKPTDHYRSVRVKRFNGPDLPGCVGNVPSENFAFPTFGDMYSVIKMTDANGKKVLYTSQFSRHSPDRKTVDMRAVDIVKWGKRSIYAKNQVNTKSALQAKLACLDHYIFMCFNNTTRTLEAIVSNSHDFNALLDSYPRAVTNLNIEQLFAYVEPFLDRHGRCYAALLPFEYGWQFVPRHVDADYKSFIIPALRDRFANASELQHINEFSRSNEMENDFCLPYMSFEVLRRFTDVDETVLFHDDDMDHESAIEQTVFDEEIWEEMKAGRAFQFDIDTGCYNTQSSFQESSNFTIPQYIMAQPEGKSLNEIIGDDVTVVTHRAVLQHILLKQMNMVYDDAVEVSCERFNGVNFVRLNKTFQSDATTHYRSVRVKRFNGPDLPGCVGNVPAQNFAFPNIGDMYSVIKMSDANGKKVLYTSQFSRHSPDRKTVDMRAIDIVNLGTRSVAARNRVNTRSAVQAKLACLDNYVFMYFNNNTHYLQAVVSNSTDYNTFLDSYPRAATTLNIEQLFAKVERVLDLHGRCSATLQKGDSSAEGQRNGWQFVPHPVDVDTKYKSFLSQAFRDRFAPEKPNASELKDIKEDVEQKPLP